MTNLDPKHLDALDALIAHNMQWRGLEDIDRDAYSQARDTITALRVENDRLSNLWQIEHDHATALRAQIDQERAATIEAAAERIEPGANANDIPKAVLTVAQASIRAMHTDATRAAMDAIWREGYEAGMRDERARMSQPRTYTSGSASVQVCPECDIAGCHHIRAIAASIPPDPDTNAG